MMNTLTPFWWVSVCLADDGSPPGHCFVVIPCMMFVIMIDTYTAVYIEMNALAKENKERWDLRNGYRRNFNCSLPSFVRDEFKSPLVRAVCSSLSAVSPVVGQCLYCFSRCSLLYNSITLLGKLWKPWSEWESRDIIRVILRQQDPGENWKCCEKARKGSS